MKDQEEQISRLIAGLRPVEAPEGFEGMVRTKIAEGRRESSGGRPLIWLAAKFALPLILLMLLGGFLIVSQEGDINAEMVPPVGDSRPEVAELDAVSPPVLDVAATNDSTPRNAAPTSDRNGLQVDQPPRGSQDIALSPDDTTVFPSGVDPRRTHGTNSKPPIGGSVSPASVLSMIGIVSNCSPSGCLATEVREGTIAAGAGIQTGDLITALDGRPVTAEGITGQFSIGEITLVRSGAKMTVSIARR